MVPKQVNLLDVFYRTIPMRPEDYQRFHPEFWLNKNSPNVPQMSNASPQNPVAFNDLAILQNELDLRRKREVHRQNSQKRETPGSSEQHSFQSLPWEDIILSPNQLRAMQERQMKKREEMAPNMTSFAAQEEAKRKRGSQNSSWFNSQKKESEVDLSGKNVKQNGHWFLKEKSPDQMQSMPPIVGTLRDSGIGEDGSPQGVPTPGTSSHLSRTGTGRSSFGIILKDKFQKNPNVYFPTEGRGSKVSNEDEDEGEDNSDTDTLIHNMSEGSFEKDGSSVSGSGSNSLGKGSSGTSSLSPHNSMEGSPRMAPKESGSQLHKSSNNPGVSMGKKTIRNYMPKESSNMLRELEDRRRKSASKQVEAKKSKEKKTSSKGAVVNKEKKTSVERMIEDFHRNLPPADSVPAQVSDPDEESTTVMTAVPSTLTSKKTSKHGTMSSQASNWSAASSSASFDYQPMASGMRRHKSSSEQTMPALREVEMPQQQTGSRSGSRSSPQGERIPPEGASATPPPHAGSFVHRLEVKSAAPNSNSSSAKRREEKSSGSSKKKENRKTFAGEDISDLLKAPSNEDDDFSNLRKLLSEGRITGLNEKPPSFVPPTPPATAKPAPGTPSKTSTGGESPTRRKSTKPPAPKPNRSQSQSRLVGDKPAVVNRTPRKTKEAPKPPVQNNSDPTRLRESLEDLTQIDRRRSANRRNNEIKRSPSNHETKTRKFDTMQLKLKV